ncbi:MAG TPA: hypothetical protein VML50_14285 [Anaeromyxobacter sp.]|nr:hypothetical protein [Anaeromyxobacter sp.]
MPSPTDSADPGRSPAAADLPSDLTEATRPERRRVLRVIEGLNLAFLAVELATYGWGNRAVLAGRVGVSLGLLAADAGLSALRSPRAVRWIVTGSLLAVVAGFAVLIGGSGGVRSPYLPFLAFVPIVLTIVVPDEPATTLAVGLAGTVAGVRFGAAAGEGLAALGFLAAAFGSCAFYGTASALLYRRMRRREREAWASRAAALAELARSEQGRLEAERLAAVGRLVAGFRHEVNNPLASATSNVRFVQHELAGAIRDADVGAALGDALEALERISMMVADLRALGVENDESVGDVDLAETLDQAVRVCEARTGRLPVLERHIPPDVPPVRASQPHLARVLGVLLSTAGENGGSSRAEPPHPVAVSVVVGEATVQVVVEGAGRSGQAVRRGPGRSSVAIALCRELAERWGGRMQPGEGPDGAPRYSLTLARWAPAP